jgi:hypothetical protein
VLGLLSITRSGEYLGTVKAVHVDSRSGSLVWFQLAPALASRGALRRQQITRTDALLIGRNALIVRERTGRHGQWATGRAAAHELPAGGR